MIRKGETMTTHFYLSLLPEALIVSMLDPEDFGTYYAVGSAKNLAGEAMFYEVDRLFGILTSASMKPSKRCVPTKMARLRLPFMSLSIAY